MTLPSSAPDGESFTDTLRSTRDSVEEFRVTTTNANADAGRSSGAQVSLVTKSGTNAIHGIVLLGGLIVMGPTVLGHDTLGKVILVIAVAFGTINVVGGFLVTDRMLGMFKRKPAPAKADAGAPLKGANSFTEGQAKDRAVANGATEIAELKKDDNGVWRGVAKHDGKSGEVAIDYKGNVVFQTSP